MALSKMINKSPLRRWFGFAQSGVRGRSNRQAMRKVFNVSLQRSGTQSFHHFMRSHGFKSAHWPGDSWDVQWGSTLEHLDRGAIWTALHETVAECEVFSDTPYTFLYREAFAAYPDARFLMIIRGIDEWVGSVRRHFSTAPVMNMDKFHYWTLFGDRFHRINDYSDDDFQLMYLRHLANVTNFMQETRAPFRVFWLSDPELGSHLADYLEFKKVHEFPSIDYHRSEAGWISTSGPIETSSPTCSGGVFRR